MEVSSPPSRPPYGWPTASLDTGSGHHPRQLSEDSRNKITTSQVPPESGEPRSVIALWLGHADTHSTNAYLHADMAIKQAAMDRTRLPHVKPGTYQPEPDILAWLTSL
jgi:hypothetical protein